MLQVPSFNHCFACQCPTAQGRPGKAWKIPAFAFWCISSCLSCLVLLVPLFNRCFACQCRNHCTSLSCFSSLPEKKILRNSSSKIDARCDMSTGSPCKPSWLRFFVKLCSHCEFQHLHSCSDLGYNCVSFAVFSLAAVVASYRSRMIV